MVKDQKPIFTGWDLNPMTEAGCAPQEDEAQWRVPFEDADAAPGYDVRLSDSKDVSCWHMDHMNNILWTGTKQLALSYFIIGYRVKVYTHSLQRGVMPRVLLTTYILEPVY